MFLQQLTWRQVDDISRRTPIIIPIAAVEQHGYHLPVYTDSFLLGEIVRRVELQLAQQVLVAPLMWLGNSEHHLDFPGTMSAGPRTYLDLLKEMMGNFLFHGFHCVLLLNGHGGNIIPSQQVLFELRQQHRHRTDLQLLAATYWESGPAMNPALGGLAQKQMGHACEWETSMMLRIEPQLVGDYAAAEDVSFEMPFSPAYQGWITKDRSLIGHIGQPRLASVEKGEQLFHYFSTQVAELIRRISGCNDIS